MNQKSAARKFAFQIYYHQVFQKEDNNFTQNIEKKLKEFRSLKAPNEQIDFIKEVLLKTEENTHTIHTTIKKYLKNWTLDRISKIDLTALSLAITEMTLLSPPTPAKVVIDEYLNLVKEFGSEDSASFVNGILNNIYKNEL